MSWTKERASTTTDIRNGIWYWYCSSRGCWWAPASSKASSLVARSVASVKSISLLSSEFFERLTRNSSKTPQLNVVRCQNPEFIVVSIITSYDLNPFLISIPKRHLVTFTHLKFWDYGAFYSTLFTIKEIMSTLIEALSTSSIEAKVGSKPLRLGVTVLSTVRSLPSKK